MLYYTSFVNPNEGVKDVFNSDNLHEIMFFNDKIEMNKDGKADQIAVIYKLKKRKSGDEEEIYLEGVCKDFDLTLDRVLDIQTLVDQAAQEVYSQRLIDNAPCIKDAKDYIKSQVSARSLENGAIALNTVYDAFGFIKSNNKKIGTFESVDLKTNSLSLKDLFSICDLHNVEELAIEFYTTNGFKGEANVEVSDAKTMHPSFTYSNLKIEKGECDEVIESKDSFEDEEEFYKARRALLSVENSSADIEDEFGDLF